MTDKVQRIHKEIEMVVNRRLNLLNGDHFDLNKEVDGFTNEIIDIINSLQDEPVSIWHDASEKSNEPEEVVIINPSDNTGEVLTRCINVYQGRIWAYTSVLLKLDDSYKIGKNLQEEPKIPQVFDEGYWERLGEEPVNKDLEIAANEWDAKASFTPFYMALDGNGNPYEVRQDYTTHAESFKAGAKWQKEKEYTCYEEAFEDGAKWQKEHMMIKAINAHCFGFQGAALFSFRLPADKYLVGSEVKVIVIKEE